MASRPDRAFASQSNREIRHGTGNGQRPYNDRTTWDNAYGATGVQRGVQPPIGGLSPARAPPRNRRTPRSTVCSTRPLQGGAGRMSGCDCAKQCGPWRCWMAGVPVCDLAALRVRMGRLARSAGAGRVRADAGAAEPDQAAAIKPRAATNGGRDLLASGISREAVRAAARRQRRGVGALARSRCRIDRSQRGGYADTWRERHDQGCSIIARGLRACRTPVF